MFDHKAGTVELPIGISIAGNFEVAISHDMIFHLDTADGDIRLHIIYIGRRYSAMVSFPCRESTSRNLHVNSW